MSDHAANQLNAAKAKALRHLGQQSWLASIGIGLVGDAPGIVISVTNDGRRDAEDLLSDLKLSVPKCIRVIGPVKKRANI